MTQNTATGVASTVSNGIAASTIPADFVFLDEAISGLQIELKYATTDNFVGAVIPGYEQARAVTTRAAAAALSGVQEQLKGLGLGLKIFDAYRPQRSVNFFVHWADDASDTRQKALFYPALDKDSLIPNGYLAPQSGHSRGSTVDVTLVRLSDGSELDMGTRFDFFGPQSWTHFSGISRAQQQNRQLLQKVMASHGFTGVKEEWWHFTLKNEPYPETAFDFIAA
ncbi:M15 family metallopeptidase [Thalassolituus sp. LLYu03]|uniref:M15 family metallopeptidase n=1 Tax=Thalassolituus sp. LLYu03 TaxID=3421656 RepID=UPI003D2D1F8F